MSATPVYQNIEFCRSPETLWAKIESKWDWLGVHPGGQFVVGYPRRHVVSAGGAATVMSPGAKENEHGVRHHVPLGSGVSASWFTTEQEAIDHFREVVEHEESVDGSGIVRVERVEQGEVVETRFVVRRFSTYR